MAFQQPTRQATQRVFRPSPEDEESSQLPPSASQAVQDSQTWVLFSPPTDAGTSTSYLTSTHKTNSTPGRSRLSEVGSLGTVAPSGPSAGQQQSSSFVDAADEDDDTELDSLDSHLAEFRSAPNFYDSPHAHPYATPVLPGHNGLGMFRLDQGADMQERLYAFEQYNPHRATRLGNLDLNHIEPENETTREMDKMKWIEAWRLEQSRCLLEEIQKETRKRRRSVASVSVPNHIEEKDDDAVTMSGLDDSSSGAVDQSQEWHDHDGSEQGADDESIWGRITRKLSATFWELTTRYSQSYSVKNYRMKKTFPQRQSYHRYPHLNNQTLAWKMRQIPDGSSKCWSGSLKSSVHSFIDSPTILEPSRLLVEYSKCLFRMQAYPPYRRV